jgi:hypothetical protein
MPAVEYHGIRALSASRLKAFLRSPAHLRHMDENPYTGAALAFGDAFHTAVLEPQRFAEEYIVAPDVDRRTKDGKAAWQMFLDANPDKTIVSHDDWLAITAMAREVLLHPTASDLLAGRSETEISMLWLASAAGEKFPCKARIDAYNSVDRCIIDLKTTQDASPEGFARSVANFSYHVQAAWYIDAMRAANFEVDSMVFIAVEKAAPYGVSCLILDEDAINEGRRRIANALPKYAICASQNRWPTYDDGIQTISLPRWAVRGEEVSL